MGDPASQGMIISALINGGSNALSSAMGPTSQERQTFEGTGADPVSWLTDARGALTGGLNAATSRANQPIDLSAARPQAPGQISARSLPRTVGGNMQGGAARVPVQGFNIDPESSPSNSPNTAIPRWPNVDLSLGNFDPRRAGASAQQEVQRRIKNAQTGGNNQGPGSAVARAQAPGASGAADPTSVGSAKLLLHSLFSQQRPGA